VNNFLRCNNIIDRYQGSGKKKKNFTIITEHETAIGTLRGDVRASFVQYIKGQWPVRAVARRPVPATQSSHREAYIYYLFIYVFAYIYLRRE